MGARVCGRVADPVSGTVGTACFLGLKQPKRGADFPLPPRASYLSVPLCASLSLAYGGLYQLPGSDAQAKFQFGNSKISVRFILTFMWKLTALCYTRIGCKIWFVQTGGHLENIVNWRQTFHQLIVVWLRNQFLIRFVISFSASSTVVRSVFRPIYQIGLQVAEPSC